jgi:hypothetical protein
LSLPTNLWTVRVLSSTTSEWEGARADAKAWYPRWRALCRHPSVRVRQVDGERLGWAIGLWHFRCAPPTVKRYAPAMSP